MFEVFGGKIKPKIDLTRNLILILSQKITTIMENFSSDFELITDVDICWRNL